MNTIFSAVSRLSLLATVLVALAWQSPVVRGQSAGDLLNINFAGAGHTKVGLAATGVTTDDVWNLITNIASGTFTNLLTADSNACSVTITVDNLPYYSSNGNSDQMLGYLLYGPAVDEYYNPIPSSVVISNLPAGNYDFYIYSASFDLDYDHESFSLTIGGNTTSTKYTTNQWYDVTTEPLQEGVQYVLFTNQTVTSGQAVTVNMYASHKTHILNGLQIQSSMEQLPAVSFSPGSGTTVPTDVTLYVTNHGSATIYYTTDGSTPTTNSSVYSSAISLTVATTIKAFATESGYSASDVSTATYLLPQLPYVAFSPASGTNLPVEVTLSVPGHTNYTIYYTLDGSQPTTNSSVYSSPISLTTNSWSYSANRVPTMTSYTTPAGNTVTYSSELSGSSQLAWKAFDHSVATQDQNNWSANSANSEWVALAFPSTRHVNKYALQCRANSGDGPKDWTFEGWDGSQYVTLDTRSNETNWYALERREFVCTNSGSFIKYRLNISVGNPSTINTNAYIAIGELEIFEARATIDAFATKANYLDSGTTFATYYAQAVSVPQVAPTPDISPAEGTYDNDIQVTISSSLSGASYKYSTNGTDWPDYTGAITLGQDTTVMAYTLKSGYTDSAIRTNSYSFTVAPTTITPNGGNFTNSVEVTLANTTTNATIQYSLNGSGLTNYTGPLTLTNTTTLTAVASKTGYTSSTNSATFTAIDTNVPPPACVLNLNFGTGSKVGLAAIGVTTNDVWNNIPAATNVAATYTYYAGSPTVPIITWGQIDPLWANGVGSLVSVTITNLTAESANGTSDAMFNSYLNTSVWIVMDDYNEETMEYITITANPRVVITNLPAATYDFFIYGLGASTYEAQGFTLTVGTNAPTSTKWTTWFEPLDVNWAENYHYVKFTNLTVNAGDVVTLSLSANDVTYTHVINGIQIYTTNNVSVLTNAPVPTISPASGDYTNTVAVSISSTLPRASYQYKLNGGDWINYTGPFNLLEDAIVIARTTKAGWLDSGASTNTFHFPDDDGDGLTTAREYAWGTNPFNPDTDYDGRTDLEEWNDATNPNSAASFIPVRLAYFRFDTNSWAGEGGRLPLVTTNLMNPDSWDGKALWVNTNAVANLKYRDAETNGSPNINLQRGTVRFWFKPDWGGTNAGGSGPGGWGRLIEMGAYTNDATYGQWVLGFNPEGTQLLVATQGDGIETNLITASVSLSSNVWHQVVLTYTTTNSILYLDGQSITNGSGIAHFPNAAVRANDGLNIGSDRDGNYQAKGLFDELETFNYPLSAGQIYSDYEPVAGRDSDGDGITDIQEHENGTDRTVSNLPFFVKITYPRAGSILP